VPFSDIKIPISLGDKDDNKCDVTSFCDVFHKEENLDEDNKFKCEFCNEEQAGKISHHMIEAPQVLVIYLKKPYRIEDKSFTLSKDTKFFALSHSFKYESDAPIAAKGEYQLYGLVMHSGSTISNGHYYSIIRQNGIHENRMGTRSNKKGNTSSSKCVCYNIDRDDLKDKWVRINDDKVKLLSDSHLNKSLQVQDPCDTPYLAFYWKTSD
jgi:ubiquitin C-terminal hydrolase